MENLRRPVIFAVGESYRGVDHAAHRRVVRSIHSRVLPPAAQDRGVSVESHGGTFQLHINQVVRVRECLRRAVYLTAQTWHCFSRRCIVRAFSLRHVIYLLGHMCVLFFRRIRHEAPELPGRCRRPVVVSGCPSQHRRFCGHFPVLPRMGASQRRPKFGDFGVQGRAPCSRVQGFQGWKARSRQYRSSRAGPLPLCEVAVLWVLITIVSPVPARIAFFFARVALPGTCRGLKYSARPSRKALPR